MKQLQMNQSSLAAPSAYSKKLASASTMMEVKSNYTVAPAPPLGAAPRLGVAPSLAAAPLRQRRKISKKKK